MATAPPSAGASGRATARCPASRGAWTPWKSSGSSTSRYSSAATRRPPRRAPDMDPQRLKDAYQKLQSLDERMTHKVRPRPGGPLVRPSLEQLEIAHRDLANYTLELKEVVQELFLSIAGKPGA